MGAPVLPTTRPSRRHFHFQPRPEAVCGRRASQPHVREGGEGGAHEKWVGGGTEGARERRWVQNPQGKAAGTISSSLPGGGFGRTAMAAPSGAQFHRCVGRGTPRWRFRGGGPGGARARGCIGGPENPRRWPRAPGLDSASGASTSPCAAAGRARSAFVVGVPRPQPPTCSGTPRPMGAALALRASLDNQALRTAPDWAPARARWRAVLATMPYAGRVRTVPAPQRMGGERRGCVPRCLAPRRL